MDKLDAGPILLQERVAIGPLETAEELKARLAGLGAEVVLKTIGGLESGELRAVEQDEAAATTAPKLTKADGRVDFSHNALAIANRIRGTWPWPGRTRSFITRAGRR